MRAMVLHTEEHSIVKKGSTVEIVGFVRGADDRPYVVVCHCRTGFLDMLPLNAVKVHKTQLREF
jgi:hypothetical protein